MSDPVVTNVTPPVANASGAVVDPAITQSQTDDVSAALKATNDRLLNESKTNKERAQRAETELASLKQKSLQDQGQFKDLYESEKQKNETLMKSVVMNAVKSGVSEAGSKQGLVSVDAAMKLGNANLLQFDTEASQVQGVDAFMDDLKKSHPYLFKASGSPGFNPTVPGGTPPANGPLTAAQIAKLPQAEQNKILGEMMGQLRN